jgi:DNA-binding response OmpR family regulator
METKTGKLLVLLIEDDPDQVFLYKTKFNLEGLDTLTALKGADGIKLAREKKPNLVLLDVLLDDIDGIEVLRQLKQNKETSGLLVILFTNLSTRDVEKQGKKLGAFSVISKTDYTPGELVKKIKGILENKNIKLN